LRDAPPARWSKNLRGANYRVVDLRGLCFAARRSVSSERRVAHGEEVGFRVPKGRSGAKKVSCDECYFRCNLLCALSVDEPCATFRPDHPEGLRPPRQMRFHFRQERLTRSAWAFPTAQEQAALHR
jgi:hypothetical protein